MIAYAEAQPTRPSARVFSLLKPLVVVLVSLGAFLIPRSAFATQITFSTPKNTAILYTLTPANLASYDPGGTFGIYDDVFCDTGTIATQHGGTADIAWATTLTCGIDYGGIGSTTRIVNYHCGASVPLFRSEKFR